LSSGRSRERRTAPAEGDGRGACYPEGVNGPQETAAEGDPPWDRAEAFRSFVDRNDDLMAVITTEGSFVYVNQAVERILGLGREECLGRSCLDFVHEDDRARTAEALERWCRSGGQSSFTFQNRQVGWNGQGRSLLWTVTPCLDGQGRVIHLALCGRDIGPLLRIEQDLAQREARTRALLAGMLDPVVTIDAWGTIQDVSHSVCTVFGYEPRDLLGRNVKLLMTSPHQEAHDGYLEHYRRTGQTGILNRTREFEVRCKDGTALTCELSVSRVEIPGSSEPLFIGSFRDVTARLRAERELAESESRFRAIFDQEFQFVGLMRPDGTLLEVNEAALQAAGIRRDEAVGRAFWDTAWWNTTDTSRARVRTAVAAAARGEFVRFEVNHRLPTGETIAVDFSVKPIRDHEGHVLTALAAIGESASILAHEIKNPITAINVALKAVADQLGEDQQVILSDLVERLQKVERTMRRTLSFARPLVLKRQRVAAGELLESALSTLRPELNAARIRCELRLAPDLAPLDVDPGLIEEALGNLIKNAREALEPGGQLRLTASAGGERRGVLVVEDDGPGIPASFRANLFKPFHTTKARGTGIGLALTRKIVLEHGGRISVDRGELGGARFTIELPAAATPDPVATPSDSRA